MNRLLFSRFRLPGPLARLRSTRESPRALERQLARARPKPSESFARRAGWALSSRWAATPQRIPLWLQVGALFAAGILLLVIALAIGM